MGGNKPPLALWVIQWKSLLWSHTMTIAGDSMGFKHWESECDGEWGRGFFQPAPGIWQIEFKPQCPSSNLNQQLCSSAEPSRGSSLTRVFGGVQTCLIQVFKQGVLQALELGFSNPRQDAESQLHPLWGVPSSSIWPEGLVITHGSCVAQWCSSQEVGKQSWSSLGKVSSRCGGFPCAKDRQGD